MYGLDYKDFLPNKSGIKGFEQLQNYSLIHDVFRCPSSDTLERKVKPKLTEKNLDYIYRSGLKISDDKKIDYSKIPVVWDKPTNHEDYGNVVFLDGQVKGFSGADWMEQAGIKKTATQQGK